jgi:hypothetical protein
MFFKAGVLSLRLTANRSLRVVEIQGPKHLLRAYGITRPSNFVGRWFADEADIPTEMMDDIAFTNRVEFRWGCDIPVAAHSRETVELPTTVTEIQPIDLGIVDVVYEYSTFFGLMRRKFSASLAVGSRENRKEAVEANAA